MNFQVSSSLEYQVLGPSTMFFSIRARAMGLQTPIQESFILSNGMSSELIVTQPDMNCFDRVVVSGGTHLRVDYKAEVTTFSRQISPDELRKFSQAQLDPRVLPYVFSSRYCESDRLGRFARQKFGNLNPGYDQVLAIDDWIFANVEYLPGVTDSEVSAFDTVTMQAGVCRDFSHLAIALCRALNIPARYLSAYAYNLIPQDFHACFEAYIGGAWIVFDPTRLAALNGLVRIGSGRDAADVSVCTIFGPIQFLGKTVTCQCTDPNFQPLTRAQQESTAVTLDQPATF